MQYGGARIIFRSRGNKKLPGLISSETDMIFNFVIYKKNGSKFDNYVVS